MGPGLECKAGARVQRTKREEREPKKTKPRNARSWMGLYKHGKCRSSGGAALPDQGKTNFRAQRKASRKGRKIRKRRMGFVRGWGEGSTSCRKEGTKDPPLGESC